MSATMWVGLAASIGGASAALGGLYPQFDDGKLRVLLGITAATFAGPLVAWASRAGSWGHVVARLLGVAMLLGIAATVPAAMILLDGNVFAAVYGIIALGFIFGSITGLLYGIPLAILAAVAQRNVADASHTGNDRAQRAAGLWAMAIGAFVAGMSHVVNRESEWMVHSLLAIAIAVVGGFVALAAQRRINERARWILRVITDLEPSYRLRKPDPNDDLSSLPRLAGGAFVIERFSDPTPYAYRRQAFGTPVAVVDPAAIL